MQILIGTDGSEYSRAAIDFCRDIVADPQNTSIKIISAVQYLMPAPTSRMGGGTTEYYFELEQSARRQAEDAIEQAEARTYSLFPGVSIDVTTEVIDGSPPRVIVETTDEWEASLVVVGSHGHGFWWRVLLGSVSDSVVRHAHCSVVTVRKQGSQK